MEENANGEQKCSLEDIEQEEISEFVLNVLIDDFDVFQNVSTYKLNNNKCITNLRINFRILNKLSAEKDTIEKNYAELLESFIKNLRQSVENISIVKYYDKNVKENYNRYYSEIYDLEMELRKVLTFIFTDEYEDPFDLIKDYDLLLPQDNRKEKNYFEQHLENEFFMLCFSDYLKIANGKIKEKNIKSSEILRIFKDALSFEDAQNKLAFGIKKEHYLAFLASIVQDINSIEEMRNAIMHGRTYSKDIGDYEKSKKQLQEKIDIFWQEYTTPYKRRRPNLNFNEMGIENNAELVFVKDNTIKVKVISPQKILYNDKEYSLSGLVKELFNISYYLSPCKYWTYNGKNLDDIYEETYPYSEN